MGQVLHTKTLVLNRSYFPVGICTVREAFKLVFKEHAVLLDGNLVPYDWDTWIGLPVEENDEGVRTAHSMVKAPRLVRLTTYGDVPNRVVKFSRQGILMRDTFTCQYCGEEWPVNRLNMDHVMPRCKGGKTEWNNIVTSCVRCNSRKADRTPEEADMRLRRKPFRPTWTYLQALSNRGKVYPEWEPFLVRK